MTNYRCQTEAIEQLKTLVSGDRHSVLIEGPEGCGKSFLAKMYATSLDVHDIQFIEPKVEEIRNTITACTDLNNRMVIVIENIETGVIGAAYTLLKFLEEPKDNVYVIVTARNINAVPDTIISRSAVISVCPPVDLDISNYAYAKNSAKFTDLQQTKLWKCVRTFKDVDAVFGMSSDNLAYFTELGNPSLFKDSVSNIVWLLGHYKDNTPTPVELVIRYIMEAYPTNHIKRSGISCLKDLSQKRVAAHASLAKFVFEAKYWE